jgi:hypothetical protein
MKIKNKTNLIDHLWRGISDVVIYRNDEYLVWSPVPSANTHTCLVDAMGNREYPVTKFQAIYTANGLKKDLIEQINDLERREIYDDE